VKKGYFLNPERKGEVVIKKFPNPIKQKHVEDFKKAHEEYIKLLKKAGVKIPETFLEFSRENKQLIPVITQIGFKEEELLDNIISKAPRKEALEAFEKMLEENFKVINFNKKNDIKIGFDGSPRNLALHNDEIYYYDTFPPYIQNKKQIKIIKTQIRKGLKTIATLTAPIILKQFHSPQKMIRSAVISSIKRRPEFQEEFKQKAISTILKHVPEEEAKSYLNFKPSLITKMVSRIRKS
jgi:hypothetical protein